VVAAALLGLAVSYASGGTIGGMLGLPLAPERHLEAAVHDAFAAAGPEDVVVLHEVTDLRWDAVGVFGPYTPHETVVATTGVRLSQGASANLHYDERCLLVFRHEDRLAGWTVVSRDVADCAGEASGQVYTADEARFRGDALRPASGR
jgi:hypothetical protein